VEQGAAQALALARQPPSLVIGEPQPPPVELFAKHAVLLDEILDGVRLSPVDPAAEGGEQELEGEEVGHGADHAGFGPGACSSRHSWPEASPAVEWVAGRVAWRGMPSEHFVTRAESAAWSGGQLRAGVARLVGWQDVITSEVSYIGDRPIPAGAEAVDWGEFGWLLDAAGESWQPDPLVEPYSGPYHADVPRAAVGVPSVEN